MPITISTLRWRVRSVRSAFHSSMFADNGAGDTLMKISLRPARRLALIVLVAACGGDAAEQAGPEETSGPQAVVLQPTDIAVVQPTRITGGVVLTGTLNPERIVQVR